MPDKKINLNQMLYNIDMANSKWYGTLDSEEKKTEPAPPAPPPPPPPAP